jgi:hypothetical protein
MKESLTSHHPFSGGLLGLRAHPFQCRGADIQNVSASRRGDPRAHQLLASLEHMIPRATSLFTPASWT